ncbi:MAG: ATP-binding cassette domain-containing protein [Acidimicrobiales bacterium]
MASAIEAHDLEKVFGGTVRALDGVSFSVEQGTVFGLLGPNGAGKTTAVRILTTILSPDAGTARVLGLDVRRDAETVRTKIGLAGQYAAVDENLTGRENLSMVGRLNHLARDVTTRRARELLAQFHLADAADRPLKTYSGGMRRRLDVAAALVARPSVRFFDEPTTGLDPQSRIDLWDVIEGLVGEGTTVLLTTQYLEEADRLADRIAVVDHGRVIAEGTPQELKAGLGATVLDIGLADASAAADVAELLAAVGAKAPSIVGSMVELPIDEGPRAAMEALRLLDQHGVVPTTFVLREPSLDDVFLALTGRTTGTGPAGMETTGMETTGAPRRDRPAGRRRRRVGANRGETR